MRSRIFIAVVLMLTLTPTFSFGAICALDCGRASIRHHRSSAAPTQPATGAHHQHHHPVRDSIQKSHDGAVQTVPHQVSSHPTCCNGDQHALSISCLSLNDSVLSEQMIRPVLGLGIALRITEVPLTISEQSQRLATRDILFPTFLSHSLPLRI